MTDLEYACTDGIWTRFFPSTPAGDAAYNVMAKADADGVVAFMSHQVPGVLAQLRKAGLKVTKAPKLRTRKLTSKELEDLLSELL